MLKTIKRENGNIYSLQTNPGKFSFSYLIRPRPENDYKAGSYGTEFIIHDEDTIKAIKAYLSETIKYAVANDWKKMPANPHLPFRVGDEENPLEAGGYVLKTSTKNQPKLFIRLEGQRTAHEISEEEIDDIYAGMIGEIIFSFAPYDYNGNCGITAYLNAVCKTADDTPLSAKISYESAFSLGSDFDEEDSSEATVEAKEVEEEDIEEGEVDVDSLIKGSAKSSKKAAVKKGTTRKAETKKPTSKKTGSNKQTKPKSSFNLDDLLK